MKLKTLMMSAAISALIAGSAVAQTETTDTTAADGTVAATGDTDAAVIAPQFTSISEMTVGDLVGQNVYEPNGETIGDIDYVVGRDGGALAVIGIGGFLGLGEYTVGLPLSDFTYDASQQMVTLDTTKEALKEQVEFDESDVESLPDETPLASLIASADATGSDAVVDDMSDDTMAVDPVVPDEGADMSDEGADMSDDTSVTGGAVTDDSATSMEAPAEADTMTDDTAVEENTTTE
ncbi:PRC-barrel domain-containing protein [Roseovarius sp. M141]|uniref:PRC-barrel domain-containing protein n=1 Tax=Roseovarius sp. M141 TaxID=2583806 RepID=UPI0020CEF6FD|nr:PRC-barrel domain-containing protein [Roseovarius sp. M141]MCQ0091065.1 hypothetical protein [Roseovarius sp. M141]